MGRVQPPAMIKVKKNEGMKRVEVGMREMTRWARITILDLDGCKIQGAGAGRLAAALGQCPSLAHLDLSINSIGAEGAGRLDAVAEQFPWLENIRNN